MRGNPGTMQVFRAKNQREAVTFFENHPDALPLAGGTDLMVGWNMGLLNNKTILDLSAIQEWSQINIVESSALIGSLVTHAQIQEHSALVRQFPLLAQACSTIGAQAIQNRGTIGGNIANASPAGDTFPVLAVYKAYVKVNTTLGWRSIPFVDLFSGPKKTVLIPGELISSVWIHPPDTPPARQFFRKVGTRAAQALSKVVMAGLLWLDSKKRVRELRVALGSVAPTVRRAKTVEQFLVGKNLSSDIVQEAVSLLRQDIAPIDDIRSTAEYRLRISQNLLRLFLLGGDHANFRENRNSD